MAPFAFVTSSLSSLSANQSENECKNSRPASFAKEAPTNCERLIERNKLLGITHGHWISSVSAHDVAEKKFRRGMSSSVEFEGTKSPLIELQHELISKR